MQVRPRRLMRAAATNTILGCVPARRCWTGEGGDQFPAFDSLRIALSVIV